MGFGKIVGTTFLELDGKYVEELSVAEQAIANTRHVFRPKKLVVLEIEMGHAFHFGKFVANDFLHAVSIGHIIATHGVNPLAVRVLVRHGILLHHVAEADDDERERHAQPHRLDGGVEFVSA
jgi:hypothetical protein